MTCNLHSLQYKTEKWPKSCWFCQLDDDLCLKNQKLNFSPLILLILMSAQRQTSMVKTLVVLVWHYIRFMVADYRTILQSFHFNQSATNTALLPDAWFLLPFWLYWYLWIQDIIFSQILNYWNDDQMRASAQTKQGTWLRNNDTR